MPDGYNGVVLRVDLSSGRIRRVKLDDELYRLYLGGSALATHFLLKEVPATVDAFDPLNAIVLAPGVATGAAVSGVSRCCITSISPATGAVGDSQTGGNLGPMIKRAGLDAIVITGRAPRLSALFIRDDRIEIPPVEHLQGKGVLEAYDQLIERAGSKNACVLQCGPAGENRVSFACLLCDLSNVAGRTGMGAVFGAKNLRAVVVEGSGQPTFANSQGLKELASAAVKRLPDSELPAVLKKHGTPGVLGFQARAGNLATRNYSRSFHPDFEKLDGENITQLMGAGETTCYACAVRCRKKVRTEGEHPVGDRLGGPEFETLGLLGSNLDITDPTAVAAANQLCNDLGLDTITMGGLAGYLFEALGKKAIDRETAVEGRSLGFGDVEGLLWLIEQTARRQGVGEVLAGGFEAAVAHFGKKTERYAVHVKNHGLAVHMPQVKPSLAVIYAACPIGADHMSSEHDWLLAGHSELGKALGIFGPGDAHSTDLSKVRMAVYSQYYYSALDALALCMFCWGPGNLFSYRDLEDLVRYATGWEFTLWELMKAGERRVNMMRQLNARRGFGKALDRLPSRLFRRLPDGPRKGHRVDRKAFQRMLAQYYALMGWNSRTGNPTEGKLMELGLDWTLQEGGDG